MVDVGDDEDNDKPRNKSLSSNVLHILERADGTDDDDMPTLTTAYDSDDEDGDNDEDTEEWEESAEEELSRHSSLGCNTGTGNSAVSQPRVAQVRVRFRNLGPEAVPQPVTAVSRVFTVLSVHCQPKSRSVISSYTYFPRALFWNIRSVVFTIPGSILTKY